MGKKPPLYIKKLLHSLAASNPRLSVIGKTAGAPANSKPIFDLKRDSLQKWFLKKFLLLIPQASNRMSDSRFYRLVAHCYEGYD